MRIILDCEPDDAHTALRLGLKEYPTMVRIGLRNGFGWWSEVDPDVSFWVSRTKTGISVRARRALSPPSGEAGR